MKRTLRAKSYRTVAGFLFALLAITVCDDPATLPVAGAQEPVPAPKVPAPREGSITPPELLPIVGPLVLRNPAPSEPAIAMYDRRYMQTERPRYDDFLKQAAAGNGWNDPNHYGALRSRLMWAIRNAEPFGPEAAIDVYGYGRGRAVLLRYLENSRKAKFARQPHHNTGIPDSEALWVLEKNEDALAQIHVTAMAATSDRYNYLKMRNKGSDARQLVVALQAVMAAHRLGIPFERSDANPTRGFDDSLGSWYAVGRQLITWDRDYAVKADGSIPSPAHKGQEAYLFNAWLATELLNWCAYIEWDPAVFDLAKRIMDHLMAVQKPGWPTLGYVTGSTSPAPDLAAFYIWPSLAIWQETGESKYRDFAIANLQATQRAYLGSIKQWNQTYSTLGQGAEALLAGVSWR